MILEDGVPYPAFDLGYQEVILLVPFVVCPPGTLWHSFAVRMYLNDVAAIEIGNRVYAYAKEFAFVPQQSAGSDLITNVMPLLEGNVFASDPLRRTGPWSSPSSSSASVPNWNDFQEFFAMPLVGVDVDPSTGAVTRTVCSYWEWDYTNAEIAPATSNHEFRKEFRSGMGGWVGQALSSPPAGAIKIRGLRWRLADPPTACQF
ncbi:MAG: hypothetical protein JO343_11150 [Candidatus Eremiobacteraeota bacterium]|nr:hypothetical protein [Candidatus Eremiobacteraeota bacterium]